VVDGPRRTLREPLRGRGPRVAPLFPLPKVFLFPGCVMPLHVFEPRYRRMVEDLLDGTGQLVMGTVEHGHADELAGSPPVRPVAGLGEICRHERLPDGRYLVWLFGLTRVRIREAASDKPYRRVAVEPLYEIAPPKEREPDLRWRLAAAILARCDASTRLPERIPISCLADLLLQRLGLPQAELEPLFEELDVEQRAERVLAADARRSTRGTRSRRGTSDD